MNFERKARKAPQPAPSPERKQQLNAVIPTQAGSMRFWGLAIEGLPLPAFLLDPSHRIVAANKPMEELMNLHARDIRGRKCWENSAWPPARPSGPGTAG
jgi:PAS domain-containing protein